MPLSSSRDRSYLEILRDFLCAFQQRMSASIPPVSNCGRDDKMVVLPDSTYFRADPFDKDSFFSNLENPLYTRLNAAHAPSFDVVTDSDGDPSSFFLSRG